MNNTVFISSSSRQGYFSRSRNWLMYGSSLSSKILALLFTVLLTACLHSSDEKFKSYSVGFSTPNVKVWVTDTKLDQRIGILGGSIQGTWEEGGSTNAVFDAPMPHEIYVSWEEDETKLHYEATVKLVDDLAQRARKLRGITFKISGKKNTGEPYLIVGMAPAGKVVVWLSNHPYSTGITGRVIEIVGEAQGKVRDQLKPYDPYSNKKRQLKE